jgi:hypothetical protein
MRLAEYTRVDDQLHGSVSLTRNLNDEDRSSENDRCMAVVDILKDQLSTHQSQLKHLS